MRHATHHAGESFPSVGKVPSINRRRPASCIHFISHPRQQPRPCCRSRAWPFRGCDCSDCGVRHSGWSKTESPPNGHTISGLRGSRRWKGCETSTRSHRVRCTIAPRVLTLMARLPPQEYQKLRDELAQTTQQVRANVLAACSPWVNVRLHTLLYRKNGVY